MAVGGVFTVGAAEQGVDKSLSLNGRRRGLAPGCADAGKFPRHGRFHHPGKGGVVFVQGDQHVGHKRLDAGRIAGKPFRNAVDHDGIVAERSYVEAQTRQHLLMCIESQAGFHADIDLNGEQRRLRNMPRRGKRLQEALLNWQVEELSDEFYRMVNLDSDDLKIILDAYNLSIPLELFTRGDLRKLKASVSAF